MLKNMHISFKLLQRLLALPEGVIIAAARQGVTNSGIEFVIVDPDNKLPEECSLDEATHQWVECSNKGSTRGV